jgi:UDP-N-acetylmuramate dehydrogenase
MNAQLQQPAWRGELRENESMAKHCSWRCGGAADWYYEPVDKQDLALFMRDFVKAHPVTWVGLGSNLLVRDGGLRGVAIVVLKHLNQLQLETDGRIYAEAGVTCARMARFCNQHGFSGADFLAGIPGTIGGALTMNAGAFGYETWGHVDAVEMMDRDGRLLKRGREEFDVAYRSVQRSADEWFSAGWFRFPARDEAEQSRVRELLDRRNSTQPIGQPSCGSVFKNPPHDYAARLIEACGLKGQCIGQACVSEKHANFIINTGNAHANDIEDLIDLVQQRVQQEFSINLQHEVRIVGER